ncbi:GNAT family N-acetyltransferase [Halorubrum sodomense]|uniref:Putative acetyltransferase n=1 Tax=Halorubrum sodomense TaxID=35743 RepID=A0A1I6HWM9_HALSD|nr:GNAT family N-acetyltransferase [Halorubrum sodomense]SFR58834.1 putative acetyltransferase [Halorubrum sodomense]
MEVRDATPRDAEAARTVHYASIVGLGPEGYDERQVRAWAAGCGDADYADGIDAEDAECVVAERDGVVVGFGTLTADPPDGYEADPDAEVTAVYVLPAVAREGVGSRLYEELERRAREHGVEAVGLTASLPAVPFYEAHGYDRVAERDHEFSSQEGTGVTGRVVEMRKKL